MLALDSTGTHSSWGSFYKNLLLSESRLWNSYSQGEIEEAQSEHEGEHEGKETGGEGVGGNGIADVEETFV